MSLKEGRSGGIELLGQLKIFASAGHIWAADGYQAKGNGLTSLQLCSRQCFKDYQRFRDELSMSVRNFTMILQDWSRRCSMCLKCCMCLNLSSMSNSTNKNLPTIQDGSMVRTRVFGWIKSCLPSGVLCLVVWRAGMVYYGNFTFEVSFGSCTCQMFLFKLSPACY